MSNTVLDVAYAWVNVYASLACIAFVIIYTTITPWWSTPTGRLIMMLVGGLAGLAVLSLWFSTYRDFDLYRIIRIVLVSIVGTALVFQCIALIRVQKDGRQDKHGTHRRSKSGRRDERSRQFDQRTDHDV